MALNDALKTDFNAPYRDGELLPAPVAKGEFIPAGTIVCINTKGFAVGGSEAADLTYAGRAETFVDNTDGQDGDATVLIRRKKAFRWLNDGTITQDMLFKPVYILNNRTLAGADGAMAGSRSKAGVLVMLDGDGVWIE
ncbi:hypothetical protein GBH04_24630 [Salmonella enterica subsp. enterica]|uniref:Uncharacterized protein n=1 Tax=Salmonella enterica TaxID=28901 RepID=A0A759MMK4_SALER|nr:hypothetical protein [Salmonella enterica subsp. enterica serovar Richmond]HAG1980889.1 hypothetical protein [Salmonella enterica]EBX1725502.1 hypothetical protein [Salmonella enterica subsp. enterica serovar Richmond]ECD2343030.1 hypothetical protein [Salmonella enterica subsp. enterica serovar Richmond]ECE7679174.1 hypothetical protein [Salmonella enterica subsp. enterica serovar Richmond]